MKYRPKASKYKAPTTNHKTITHRRNMQGDQERGPSKMHVLEGNASSSRCSLFLFTDKNVFETLLTS